MDGERWIPNKEQRFVQRAETNCEPRSDVIVDGTQNREIHEEKRAEAQSKPGMEDSGFASDHLVVIYNQVHVNMTETARRNWNLNYICLNMAVLQR